MYRMKSNPFELNIGKMIGRGVRIVRERTHLSGCALNRKLGLSQATINKLELGKVQNPSLALLHQIGIQTGSSLKEILEVSGII